jgi:2-polyprenyl-6-methoxyphenol hydroxylase-like FAD-dependent oxidoreductase
VGARCAGSPLAALLARQGLRVAVVERARFPRDTLSTHIFQTQALAFLDRLGVAEKVRATGAPLVGRVDGRQGDLRFVAALPQRPGDIGGVASVRRHLLDTILAGAAAEAGAEMLMGTKLTRMVWERGRVAGVRVSRDGEEGTLRARVVVGADGRNSTLAGLVGARKYNLTPSDRFAHWSFFEGANTGPDPTLIFHRWDDRLVIATPADSGLYQVLVIPDLAESSRFRQDLEGRFMEHALSCAPVAGALSGARRVGKMFGLSRWEGFFRDASGPGWVLAGDAGHFKDPVPGQGIQDAFRQADALAQAILGAFGGSDDELDRTLAAWGRWRDRDAAAHYWLAAEMGKGGAVPAVLPEIGRRLMEQGELELFLNLFNHRERPSAVLTPRRLLGATARLLARGGDRGELLRELATLATEEVRHQRLNHRPAYVPAPEVLPYATIELDELTKRRRMVGV